MAAGIVLNTIKISDTESMTLAYWVPDTSAPLVGAKALSVLMKTDGTLLDPAALATAANQVTMNGYMDGVETLLTAIDGHVDGVETLLTAIDGHVDGLEGYLDGVEGFLSTIATAAADVGAKAVTGATGVSLATDQPTVAVAPDTAKISNGVTGTNLTPKFAKFGISASGATEVVALVSAKKIRVISLAISVNGAVNVKWQSHTAGDKTGLLYCAAAGDGEVLPLNVNGWFETVAGEALDINLSAGVAVGGHLSYIEV